LGPVEAFQDGLPVPFGRPRQRAVLGYLLLNAGRSVTVDQLVDAVWGGAEPSTARSQVQADAAALRRTMDGFGVSCLNRTSGGAYRVDVAAEQFDLQLFTQLVHQARRAAPTLPAQAVDDVRTALSLWRGRAFADVRAAYVEAARVWLEESRLAAFELIADAMLALGRNAEVVTELTPVVDANPLRESLVTRLMLALYRAGRQVDALRVARRVRAELTEREGLDPSRAVTDLETAILRTDPALDREPTGAAQLFRGTAVVVPAQLPPAVASLVGRRADLARLDALLTAHLDPPPAAGNLVVAIVGTAGVGKTALAVRWAHEVRHRFPDGQLFADMRGYASAPPLRPIDVLARFLSALGVPEGRIPADLDQATALYRSVLADRRLLVLLDNAGGPDDVRPLLPGAGGLVVVTSRNRMSGLIAHDGARQVVLDVLDGGAAAEMITDIVGAERAGAEPHAVATMVAACAGLPLALGIAAAHVAVHPARSMSDYLADLRVADSRSVLDLVGDQDTAVRAVFEPSYRTLPPPARRLLRLCGLLPGPDVTVDAAAALADASTGDAARLLDRLTSGHLLTEHAPGRYGCHDLLRQYAVERGLREDSPDERESALHRLYAYYIATADAAVDLVKPGGPRLDRDCLDAVASRRFDSTGAALAWLDDERANLVAAVRAGVDGRSRRAAGRLADALRGYLWVRSNVVDWLAIDNAALSAAVADDDAAAEAAAHLSLGNVYGRAGKFPAALSHYELAVERYERIHGGDGLAATFNGLGHVYRNTGRLEDALKQYEKALVVRRQLGEPAAEAVSMLSLGLVYHDLGRLEPAARHTRQAASLFRAAGSRHGEGGALSTLGGVCQALGRFERAGRYLDRALRLTQEAGSQWNEAETLRVLAEVDRDLGRHGAAVERAGAALTLATAVEADMLKPYVLNTLGSVECCLGRHNEALDHHEEALEQARRYEVRMPEVDALLGLATAHLALRRIERARIFAHHALGLARQCGYRLQEGHALVAVGKVQLVDGSPGQAHRSVAQALAVYRKSQHPLGEGRALLLLGRAQESTPERAVRCWWQAVEIFAALGTPEVDDARALLARMVSLTGPNPSPRRTHRAGTLAESTYDTQHGGGI
jgi:DNA-binding SARP family transcriptional activator/tetratricopeptide (TPR) repeat protein